MGDTESGAGALVEKGDSSLQELIKLIERLIEKATKDSATETARRIREIDELIERERKRIDDLDDEIDKLDDEIEDYDALPEGTEKKKKKKAAERLRRRKQEREADRDAAKGAKEALEKEKTKLIEKLSQ
jgi:hypothetical protein